MKFDLHTHSDRSDGTEPPRVVAQQVAKTEGLIGFGMTDHDTTAGWDEAAAEAAAQGLALIRGMELSCSSNGISVHVLSYLHDPTYQPLLDEIAKARTSRLERAKKMTEMLARDYPMITWEMVQEHTGEDATVGRPHLADALVTAGVVPNRSAAFETILKQGSKYYVPHYAVDPVHGVELIREAGGVPVFAHPAAEKRGRIVDDQTIHEMIDAGLVGLEIHHRDNSPAGQERLARIAADRNLLVTGSSDYHGDGKPNRLGENTTDRETVEQIAALATSDTEMLWNGR